MASPITSVVEPELELMMLALRIASTYCNIAEADAIAGHGASSQRALRKARKEIASVERRLETNQSRFVAEKDMLVAYIAELEGRIESLERLAA